MARLLLTVVLLASSALAQQAPEMLRALYFNPTTSAEGIQEIATAIARMTGMPQSNVEARETSLMLRGTTGQIALAEWLFTNLDQSPSEQARQNQLGAKHEYRVPGSADDIVRVFYLSNPEKVGDFQEIATAVSATADLKQLATYNDLRAIVMRGTSAQASLAEFLFAQMDRPGIELNPPQRLQSSASAEFRTDVFSENLVRVFYSPNTTVLEFQEEYTLVRVMARFQRCFAYNAARAIAAHGTDGQLALTKWLLTELDKASIPEARANLGAHEFKFSRTGDEFVRVFYLTHVDTRQRFNEIASQVQKKAKDPEVFPFPPRGVIVVRGTTGQIELADLTIQEQDR